MLQNIWRNTHKIHEESKDHKEESSERILKGAHKERAVMKASATHFVVCREFIAMPDSEIKSHRITESLTI